MNTRLPTPNSGFRNLAIPAIEYDFQQLAEIYNQTRVDYIVPMPMNAKRMQEYVVHYDIDLQNSIVATDEKRNPLGLAMLGVRDFRTWITRLGVSPDQRERQVGSFLMECLIENSRDIGANIVQLEVIVGNEPARHMFLKFGFRPTRELLVIRRPPKPLEVSPEIELTDYRELNEREIPLFLQQREMGATWVEESSSLLNGGSLKGIAIRTREGYGWVIFTATPLQIQHVVLHATRTPHYEQIMVALLYYMHSNFPNRDTKIENVPTMHPTWRAYQKLGYVISFRRIEMMLNLMEDDHSATLPIHPSKLKSIIPDD